MGFWELVRHRAGADGLNLSHAFWSCTAGRRSWLLRRILRGALGLQLLGVKDAIAIEAAVGQRLGIVLERVGRRLGAGVVHVKRLIFFHQHKLNVRPLTLD